jgi:hypothetical protein
MPIVVVDVMLNVIVVLTTLVFLLHLLLC